MNRFEGKVVIVTAPAYRGEAGASGAAAVMEGTARRLKLAIVAGLEFGRT